VAKPTPAPTTAPASPRRTCIGCRRVAGSGEMIRISLSDGRLAVGPGPGRGAWLCRDAPDCVERALRRGALGRALRVEVAPEALEALRTCVGGAPSGGGGAEVCEDGGSGRIAGSPRNKEEGP